MDEKSTAAQIAGQLSTAEAAIVQLQEMSTQIDKLGSSLNQRVEASAAQLEMFERSLGQLRETIAAFVQLPNGVEKLSRHAEQTLEEFDAARADLKAATDVNKELTSSVTGELHAAVNDAISGLATAAAASVQEIRDATSTARTRLQDTLATVTASANSLPDDVGNRVDLAIRPSIELLESSLRAVQESAASAIDPSIASAREFMESVADGVGRLSVDLEAINDQGMSQLRKSVGEAFGGIEGLLAFAQERIRGIVDEYRASVLAVLHDQRQGAERVSAVVGELSTMLSRSNEIELLSARLADDVELLGRIERAVGSPKPSMAIRLEMAITAAVLSGLVAWVNTDLTLSDALLVILPAPLVLLWLEPVVTPLLSTLRLRRAD